MRAIVDRIMRIVNIPDELGHVVPVILGRLTRRSLPALVLLGRRLLRLRQLGLGPRQRTPKTELFRVVGIEALKGLDPAPPGLGAKHESPVRRASPLPEKEPEKPPGVTARAARGSRCGQDPAHRIRGRACPASRV